MKILRRKIETTLEEWKRSANKKPLVIKGCRQCGKTYSVKEFAYSHYKHVAYVNFMERDDYASAFKKSRRVDDILLNLTALIDESVKFEPGKTCLILDEIQECAEARASLKFFKLDGRFDVIATGSLLGVKGYGNSKASIPVGYEEIINMYPLDFEEFLWANGIQEIVIDKLRECLELHEPVPEAIHGRMREMILHYIIVGGMPEAVSA